MYLFHIVSTISESSWCYNFVITDDKVGIVTTLGFWLWPLMAWLGKSVLNNRKVNIKYQVAPLTFKLSNRNEYKRLIIALITWPGHRVPV